MDVQEYRRRAEKQNAKTIRLYNPDTENFTVSYCGEIYTLHALEIDKFLYPVANHIKKHLANHLLNKRGIKTNAQDDLASIMKEIEI